MKERPNDPSSLDHVLGKSIPRTQAFPIGVDYANQIYQLPISESKEPEFSIKPMEKRNKSSAKLPLAFGSRPDMALPPILSGAKVRPVLPISAFKENETLSKKPVDQKKDKKETMSRLPIRKDSKSSLVKETQIVLPPIATSEIALPPLPTEEEESFDSQGSNEIDPQEDSFEVNDFEESFEVYKMTDTTAEPERSNEYPPPQEDEEDMESEIQKYFDSKHHIQNVDTIQQALETEQIIEHDLAGTDQQFVDPDVLRKELESVAREAAKSRRVALERKSVVPSRSMSVASDSYSPILDSITQRPGDEVVVAKEETYSPFYDAILKGVSRPPSVMKVREEKKGSDTPRSRSVAGKSRPTSGMRVRDEKGVSDTPMSRSVVGNTRPPSGMRVREEKGDSDTPLGSRSVANSRRPSATRIKKEEDEFESNTPRARSVFDKRSLRPSVLRIEEEDDEFESDKPRARSAVDTRSRRSSVLHIDEEEEEELSGSNTPLAISVNDRRSRPPSVLNIEDEDEDFESETPRPRSMTDRRSRTPSALGLKGEVYKSNTPRPRSVLDKRSRPLSALLIEDEDDDSDSEAELARYLNDMRSPSILQIEEADSEFESETPRPQSALDAPTLPHSGIVKNLQRQDTAIELDDMKVDEDLGQSKDSKSEGLDLILKQSLEELRGISKSLNELYVESEMREESDEEDTVELVYDADKQSYFDPRSGKYYELEADA